jgi:hypothetical protein
LRLPREAQDARRPHPTIGWGDGFLRRSRSATTSRPPPPRVHRPRSLEQGRRSSVTADSGASRRRAVRRAVGIFFRRLHPGCTPCNLQPPCNRPLPQQASSPRIDYNRTTAGFEARRPNRRAAPLLRSGIGCTSRRGVQPATPRHHRRHSPHRLRCRGWRRRRGQSLGAVPELSLAAP